MIDMSMSYDATVESGGVKTFCCPNFHQREWLRYMFMAMMPIHFAKQRECFVASSIATVRALGSGGAMTRFDTTRWSMVMRAGNDPGQARSALETLCRTYRPPVIEYVRRRGYDPETAEDLAQTFFTHFLERAYYADADPERGRFRAFLLIALKRFLIDAENEARTAKRGGRFRFKSLDDHEVGNEARIAADADTPEHAFERCWAVTLLGAAMGRLRKEATRAGKRELFDQLHQFLTERPDDSDYVRVAQALNLRRNTVAVAVHRMRHRLRELVREELAQTTVNRAGLESEIRDLRAALGRAVG